MSEDSPKYNPGKPKRFAGIYKVEAPCATPEDAGKVRVDLLKKVVADLEELRGWAVRNCDILFEKYQEAIEGMIAEEEERENLKKEEQKHGI